MPCSRDAYIHSPDDSIYLDGPEAMCDLDCSVFARSPYAAEADSPEYGEILFHTFVTSAYVSWIELLLESFRYHHGEGIHVRIDGMGLSDDEMDLLFRSYRNIEIHNKAIPSAALADELGVDVEAIDRFQWELAKHNQIPNENRMRFKRYITVTSRYRSMKSLLTWARNRGYSTVLHSDADIYVRERFDRLFRIVGDHDVAMYLRPHRENHAYKVLGAFLGFNLAGPRIDRFMDNWMAQIDKVPPAEQWRGFGQSAIWFALRETSGLAVADLATHAAAPRYSKLFERDAAIWLGNSAGATFASKVVSLDRSWTDYKARLPRAGRVKHTFRERFRLQKKRISRFRIMRLLGGISQMFRR